MSGNPFGDPGQAHSVEYWADKGDGHGRQLYRHTFNRSDRPVLGFTPKTRNLIFRGGSYDYMEHGGKIWLTNPPRTHTLTSARGGDHRTREVSKMAKHKKARVSGGVVFVGGKPNFRVSGRSKYAPKHRGRLINPPALSGSGKVWMGRGIALAAGGVVYFGGEKALGKWADEFAGRNPEAAQGILMGAGIAVGIGSYMVTRDKFAALAGAAIPVAVGGFRLIQLIRARMAKGAGSVPGASATTSALGPAQRAAVTDGVVGMDVTDDNGNFIGRVIAEVTDDVGRVIGHLLDDGQAQMVVSGGAVISRVPIGYEPPITGVARLPIAMDPESIARVAAG